MFTRYILPGIALITLGFAVVQMTKAQQKPTPFESAGRSGAFSLRQTTGRRWDRRT